MLPQGKAIVHSMKSWQVDLANRRHPLAWTINSSKIYQINKFLKHTNAKCCMWLLLSVNNSLLQRYRAHDRSRFIHIPLVAHWALFKLSVTFNRVQTCSHPQPSYKNRTILQWANFIRRFFQKQKFPSLRDARLGVQPDPHPSDEWLSRE